MRTSKSVHHDNDNVFPGLGKTEKSVVVVGQLVGRRFPGSGIGLPLTAALPKEV